MMFSTEQLRTFLLTRDRRLVAVLAGLLLGALSTGLALLLVMAGPLVTFIALIALAAGIVALNNLDAALLLVLVAVGLLPFGTLPFEIALTPSIIDTTLGLFLVVYAFQWMTGQRYDLHTTPAHPFILAFMLVLVFAFVLGLANAPLTAGTLRRFVAMLANIGMALIMVDVVRQVATLRRVVLTIMLIGAASALIGTGLWFLNDDLANDLLNRLARIGYPGGDVLRYREDGVRIGVERAIGTWVDPNAFGGYLMMTAALIAPQVVARRPLIGSRLVTVGLFGLVLLALFLTDSRGSMLGFLAGTTVVAVIRYRKLVWVLLGLGLLALALPPTQAYIERVIMGVQGQDLATQMRFGEYRDALRLIQRYPLVGVGFGAPPDIDLYLGVASTYLTILTNAGIVGLLAFGGALGSVLVYAYQHRHAVLSNDETNDLALGVLAGLIGALVGGIFDHFYFNIDFQATSLVMWLYVGFLLAAVRLAQERVQQASGHAGPDSHR